MSCAIDPIFIRKYPEICPAIFISSTENGEDPTDTHISNAWDGYLDELKAVGQATTSPGIKKAQASPYSTRLRPVTNISEIYKAQSVFLESLEFCAYDVTLTGATGQDSSTLTEIYDSKSTDDAYAQSLYRNAMVMNWQPNGCRPEFMIDGHNALFGLSGSAFGNNNNKGDLSIGIPLNYCFPIYKEYKKVSDIRVHGEVWQKVLTKYQRYALMCVAQFRIGFSNPAV